MSNLDDRYWLDWELPPDAELRRIANETIFRDRPDLQYKFDRSAPPLIVPDAPSPHS